MSKLRLSTVVSGIALASTIVLPFAANAQTTGGESTSSKTAMHAFAGKRQHGVSGVVASISGTTITLTVKATSTPDTIDASSAKLMGGIPGISLPLSDIQVGDKISVMGTVSGTTITAKTISDRSLMGRNIFKGKVTVVNGSLITISGMKDATTTIDGSSATITKGMGKNATSTTIGAIAVGDHLVAIGTLSGSTVTATAIYDSAKMMKKPELDGKEGWGKGGMMKPAAMGKVSGISGSILTITGMKGVTSTVDATSATVTKGFGPTATSSTVSAIQVGDYISAQGTVSGTTITATTIQDLGTMSFPTGKGMMGNKGKGHGGKK